ncbi:MAG: phage tail assembly chaperone [Oscillospiraceae bacterium]
MGKLQDFLMESDIRTEKTEVQIAPFPFPFVIQSITEGENKAIRRSCQKANFDKRTRQKQTETDTDLYNSRLVAACSRGT